MTESAFNDLISEKLRQYTEVINRKKDEYATDDRLHNFRVAAVLQQCTAEQTLFGFMTKHLVSSADMCRSGESYTDDIGDEKIGDSINYLLLLRAVVADKSGRV